MVKTCSVCKVAKPTSDFYANPLTLDGFGSQCRICDRFRCKERRRQKKLALVATKGGKCEHCGYARNIAALQFHHHSGKKELEINRGHVSIQRLLEEIKKCLLVCSNCHAEIHHPDLLNMVDHFPKDQVKEDH